MKRNSSLVIALLIVVQLAAAQSAASQSISVSLEIAGLTEAGPPRILDGRVLFTYAFAGAPRPGRIHTVGVAFAHEDFQTIRAFERNEAGVFVLLTELPIDMDEIRYRLIVDGIWTTDPNAPGIVRDRWGVGISRAELPQRERPTLDTPIVHADGTVEFTLAAPAGSRVSLLGSFNGWDPFTIALREASPGRFVRRLRLPPGEHFYYFMVDGVRLPDPTNSARVIHLAGAVISVVRLP